MRRMLLWSCLILLALLSRPATARLTLYEGRAVFVQTEDNMIGVTVWQVEGVATVEIGSGGASPSFFFDCNTTANDGSGIVWTREVVPIDFMQTEVNNGRRLEFGMPDPEDLGVYICTDQTTNEQVSLNITSTNPGVCAVDDQKAVVVGQSVELEVYVSGIPPVISSWITWSGPDGNVLTESDATFQDSKRRVVLNNVQTSHAGIYRCRVDIPVQPTLGLFLTSSDTIQLEIYSPSEITQDPQSLIGVEEWSEVVLSCTATGHPLPTISWEREGGELPVFSQTNSSATNGMVVSTLTIGTVRYMDTGRYRCSADNTETAVVFSQYAELSVIPSLRLEAFVEEQPRQFTDLIFVAESSRVRVECFGSGTLQWTSSTPGLEITSNSQDPIYQQPDHSRSVQTLHIQSFDDDALSIYTCATDLLDSTNNAVQVAVFITNSNPAVFIAEETLYVLQDTTVTITANIIAHPAVDSIEWFHEGSLVDPAMDTRFSISDDRRELSINNVEESVLGTYEVVATIGNETATDRIAIQIPAPPSAFVTPENAAVNIGSSIQFQCTAEGGGDLVVVWNVDGDQELPEGVRQSGTSLVIDSAVVSHAGTYVCTVENLVGMATDSAVFLVNHPPSAIISNFQQSSMSLSVAMMVGETAPLFTCTSSGYPEPTITWLYEGAFSSDHENGLPDGVILADASREMEARELLWQRALQYTDSGTYRCTASNGFGTSDATLDLLVRSPPVINTIFPVEPVMEESPSTGLTAFSVPNGYAGNIVACHGFAWPTPNVEWTRVGGPLPLGVSFDVRESDGGNTVARLSIDDSFSASATGMYMCTVSYKDEPDVAVSQTIEILEGSTTVTPTTCSVSSASINFQVRVSTTDCQEWDSSLMEVISTSFAENLDTIVEDDCQCSLEPGSIAVESLKCSGVPNMQGASLFRGTIETDSVAQTEQVFCTLLAWQQSGPLVNVNGDLHEVDSVCSLAVDSFTAEECVPMDTGSSFDVQLIIYIAAPVGGTVLLVVVVLMLICIFSKCGRRGKATLKPRSREQGLNNERIHQDTHFYGGAAVSPAPDAEAAQRTSRSTEQSLMFDDLAYQASIDHNPHLRHEDPSPEHARVLPSSASKDRLLEMVDAGHSPGFPPANVTPGSVNASQVQPYQLPVISSGSVSRVGLSSVSGSRSNGSHTSATNPMFVMNTTSDTIVNSDASSSNQSPSSHPTAYATRTLVTARVTSPSPYATYHPPVSALPPLPPLNEKEDSPILLSSNPSYRRPGVSSPLSPSSHLGPSVSSPLSPSNASIDSVTKLSLAATPAPSVPYSEDLPPYTSRPTSTITENRRPPPNGTGTSSNAGGRPWYQADSDLSISSNSRQEDINPYATTRNAAIPYSNATSRSSLPSSRGSLPQVNGSPRTLPAQAAQQTQLQLPPQPYAQPIVRSSLSTLSTVQGNRTFEMVTV